MLDVSTLFQALSLLNAESDAGERGMERLHNILEIAAVFEGIKPAHLNGQGHRDEFLIGAFEVVARHFDLITLRTQPVDTYWHRRPSYDPELDAVIKHDLSESHRLGPAVLWVYRDQAVSSDIHLTVEGTISCSRVLGYPECCVRYRTEGNIRELEILVDAAMQVSDPPPSPAEFIERWSRNPIKADRTHYKMMRRERAHSERVFPYVGFHACPECIDSVNSPAARINAAMRDLANRLSSEFAREIVDHRRS